MTIGAFTHKKDRDFHRDWNTEIFCACSDRRKYLANRRAGIILLTKLRMPDIKLEYNPCPCRSKKYHDYLLERSHIRRDANNRANSQIIANNYADRDN